MKKENPKSYLDDLNGYPCRIACEHNVRCPSHVNLETEFIIVQKGELIMTIENVRHVIKPNEGIFVLPFETHSFESKSSDCYIILFNRNIATTFYNFIQNKTPITRTFPISNLLIELIGDFCPYNNIHYFEQIAAEAIIAPITEKITHYCKFNISKTIKSDLVVAALSVINEQFLFPITLEQIAEEIGCHPVTLSKTFYATAGIHFSNYICLRRCYYAKTLLEKTEDSITNIALNSGFGSLRDFNRCFKKFFSITPTQYKNQIGLDFKIL